MFSMPWAPVTNDEAGRPPQAGQNRRSGYPKRQHQPPGPQAAVGQSQGDAAIIGVDLGKTVFQLCVADSAWRVTGTLRLSRTQFERYFINRRVALVVMEACGTSHHWARELIRLGHDVRLMPPSYVKAYLKRSKNDANDAAASSASIVAARAASADSSSPSSRVIKAISAGVTAGTAKACWIRTRWRLARRCRARRFSPTAWVCFAAMIAAKLGTTPRSGASRRSPIVAM